MATKDWNGFKKSGDTYIPNDATARANITAIKDGTNIESFGDVETALNGKSDFFTLSGKLEWDEDMVTHEKILHGSYTPTVTANNENPVTSKGVYNFAFPRDEQAVLGAKNINATDYSKASALTNITATFNNDGTITANGTTTANESLAGGSAANFKAWYTGSVRIASAPENVLMTLYDATAGANVGIAGQTCNMTAGHDYRLSITFLANKTFTNVVVNPLIVLATDLDDTPAPYAMTNKELTDEIKEMFLPVKMKDGYFEDWTFGIHDADTLGAGGVAEISNGNAANISHLPSEVSVACSLYTISPFNNYYRQFCLMRDSIDIYVRIKTSGNAYGNWHKFGITQV